MAFFFSLSFTLLLTVSWGGFFFVALGVSFEGGGGRSEGRRKEGVGEYEVVRFGVLVGEGEGMEWWRGFI